MARALPWIEHVEAESARTFAAAGLTTAGSPQNGASAKPAHVAVDSIDLKELLARGPHWPPIALKPQDTGGIVA